MERKISWMEFVKMRKMPPRPKQRHKRAEIEITPPIIPGFVVKPLGFAETKPTAPLLNEGEESDCISWGSDFDDVNSDDEGAMDHSEEIQQNKINTYLEIFRTSQTELGDPETTSGSNPSVDQKMAFVADLVNKYENGIVAHDLIAKIQPFLLTDVNYVPADNGSRPAPKFQQGTSSERHQNVTASSQKSSNIPSRPQNSPNISSPPQNSPNIPSSSQNSPNISSPPQNSPNIPSSSQNSSNIPSPPQNSSNIPSPPQGAHDTNPPGMNPNSSTHSETGIPRRVPAKLVKSAVVSKPAHPDAALSIPPPLPSRPPPVSRDFKKSIAISRLNTHIASSQGHGVLGNFKTTLEEKLNLIQKPQANPTSDTKSSGVQTSPIPVVRIQPCVEPTIEKQPPPLPKSKPSVLRKPTTTGGLPLQEGRFAFALVNPRPGREEIGVPDQVKKVIDIKSSSNAKSEATKEETSCPKHITVPQIQSGDLRDWFMPERPTLPTKQKPMRKALSLSSIVEAVEKIKSEKRGKKFKRYKISLILNDGSSEGNQEAATEFPRNQETLDLSSQAWYHPITWTQALRKLLEMKQDGAFLVRPRKTFDEGVPYTISFSAGGRILNCHIVMTKNGKYKLGKSHFNAKEFDTLSELIRFHQTTPALLKVDENDGPIFVRFLITPEKDKMEV